MSFTDDAMKSFQKNRALRQRKAPFQKMEENYFINTTRRAELKYAEITPEELRTRRQALIRDKKKGDRTRLFILIGLVLVIGFAFWLFLFQVKLF